MTCQGCSVISNSEKPPTKKQPSFLFIGRLTEKKRIKTERGKKKHEHMQSEQASGLAAPHSFSSACPVPLTSH